TALSRALAHGAAAFRAGEREAAAIAAGARRVLADGGVGAVDYVTCLGPDDLEPVASVDERTVLAVAARVGATRLIDNVALGPGLDGDVRVAG
ncbi:MAG TPA: pantoate--beta-alanine ligase, partial [Streptosporangiaceae bacterium]|nr:pantoate--beta-alanine ligase [Streptosporangiaceae bacterium]